MATEYIVVQERGIKGADAPTWIRQKLTIPADWDNTFTLPTGIALAPDGGAYAYLLYNGLQYGEEFLSINGLVTTWNHPYLTLEEGDQVTLWYVAYTN